MRVGLCTTTINVPKALEWYRACGTARFFVALDEKTDPGATQFLQTIGNTMAIPLSRQAEWKCCAPIGKNSIQKRNLAFLEALKWGADLIVSADDDNYPMNRAYFATYEGLFAEPFSGLQATTIGFFDSGEMLIPKQKQRGIPHDNNPSMEIGTVTNARIGVAQGLCMGAADVDAATRFDDERPVHQMSEVVRAGLVVDPGSRTIWNSQNTAIVRELVPAWGMIPHVGRMDDIYASIICHRIMREYGYYAHYGLPAIWQSRNPHNLIKDMRAEIDGYDNAKKLAMILDNIILPGKSVLADCRQIWRTLSATPIFPPEALKAMVTWLDDVESVL